MPRIYKPKSNVTYSKGCYLGENNTGLGGYKITSGAHHLPPCGYAVLEDKKIEMAYGGILQLNDDILKRDYNGFFKPISKDELRNKSVAFYFASYENAKCRSFTPFLTQFYKSINSSTPKEKIEIILVSLDKDEEKFNEHIKHMPWAVVAYNSDLRKHLIKRYQVREDPESLPSGSVPITGLPKLVVVGENGEKLHWLSCDNHSQTILREWDFHSSKWA
ncbi:thioredoxin-like protein 1, putative [Plasmodium gallinaceum]|uniref:Thioredoxin-like protein 1, putative n=1 Tax=Plasmodium gallinaceum TaxID=5849 RepID=A0A1J1H1J9_PLAGA|nr:thioredoxin-like protein 1, putative [Plasmodium gallinaceum]CRG97189.1 thioredoxin-like protein 1, putative [Plasmodium gallinaceum]